MYSFELKCRGRLIPFVVAGSLNAIAVFPGFWVTFFVHQESELVESNFLSSFH